MASGSLSVLLRRDTVQKEDYDKDIRDCLHFLWERQKTNISIPIYLVWRFGCSHSLMVSFFEFEKFTVLCGTWLLSYHVIATVMWWVSVAVVCKLPFNEGAGKCSPFICLKTTGSGHLYCFVDSIIWIRTFPNFHVTHGFSSVVPDASQS